MNTQSFLSTLTAALIAAPALHAQVEAMKARLDQGILPSAQESKTKN